MNVAKWICGSAVLLMAMPLQAAILRVAMNGTDSVSCGAVSAPCRTISQAIDNAVAGDTVEVGAGRYGDLNGDGLFTLAGEEPAEVDTGCDCVVHVDKAITLRSAKGAGATLIHAGGASVNVIFVDVPGVTVGKPRKGFTLMGTHALSGFGVLFDSIAGQGKIEGNLAVGNNQGIGADSVVMTVSKNWAVGNVERGFYLNDSTTAVSNTAIGNGSGFEAGGESVILKKNIAVGNGAGFTLNTEPGVQVTNNSAIGNQSYGMSFDQDTTSVTFSANNIYANFDPSMIIYPEMNCGVVNNGNDPLVATNNYWGSASGPGMDPADDICESSSSITATPFKASAVGMSVAPMK